MSLTTLILGAGASMDYGYPNGSQLIKDVVLMDPSQYTQAPNQIDEIRKAQDRLKRSQADSIDYFFSLNDENKLSLKPAMLLKILDYENEELLFKLNEQHWYQKFFNKIISNDLKKTKDNFQRLKIITFNYDRSLEHFLLNMIMTRIGQDRKAALNTLASLEIIHVYGRVHAFQHENNPTMQMPIDYGARLNINTQPSFINSCYEIARNHLRTCFDSSELHQKSLDIIASSKNILFLGFAYHPENMKCLGFDFTKPARIKMFGTAYKIHKRDLKSLEKKYNAIRFFPITILELLENYYSFQDVNHVLES